MAVTRRGYIYGAFVSSVVCVILIIVAIASDAWIVSTMYSDNYRDSTVTYGLFSGEFGLFLLTTPSFSALYMTCVPSENACAVSCKTVAEARKEEVKALAQGYRPNDGCSAVTIVNTTDPLPDPPVLPFGVYVSVLLFLFIQLALAAIAAALALLNALKNPTEPIFSLPGCVWTNVAAECAGLIVMLTFGIYWAASTIKKHLAFSYVALGSLTVDASLGYSYWVLIGAVICSMLNVVLLETRRILLERDPPPPTIKVENHSDGTIFLY
ncbi:uncharacterized protein LOC116774745 isoform X1 [Danaus plexippus]|nr:uncharacterized protein LOC116774745 isoform X1 [Danaus plexippus]